jgi:hypothetical protein
MDFKVHRMLDDAEMLTEHIFKCDLVKSKCLHRCVEDFGNGFQLDVQMLLFYVDDDALPASSWFTLDVLVILYTELQDRNGIAQM